MEDRVPPYRTRVKGKPPTSTWAKILVFLFFLSFVLLLFLRSPFSKIDEIRITGISLLTTDEILKQMRVQTGDSFFHISEAEIKKRLQKLPEVKEVDVDKSFPNRIRVQITERSVIAYFRTNQNRYIPILEKGVILSNRPTVEIPASMITFEGFAPNSQLFMKAIHQFSLLPEKERTLFQKAEPLAGRPDQLVLTTKYGHRVVVRAADLSTKIKYYQAFQKEPSGTVYLLESIWFSPEEME